MENLSFLIVLAILIITLINNSNINSKLKDILREIEKLRNSVSGIEKSQAVPKPVEKPIQPNPVEKPPVRDFHEEVTPAATIIEEKPESKPALAFTEPVASSYEDTVKAKLLAMQQNEAIINKKPETSKPLKQSTDIEKFVGENLISKIGIIILVLGVGFFVKYAIDQNWIGVYGRAAIGLLIGGILVSLAHYMRKEYKTFSSLLTGGGFAVFYLTIAIAFHQYHIFSQTAAFALMVLITIFSVLLSLVYDKKELAIFSQIGGYAAPFMVATGDGNYAVLFSYLLILNAGLLVLAYFKRWHILNFLAFLFTVIIFSGWLATTFRGKVNPPYLGAMMFASSFYLVFFLVNILNNVKERQPFKAAEIGMILSNNLFFFISGLTILYSYEHGVYKGLFTVLVGLFNFGWVLYLYKKGQVDKNLIYLLIGLVMSYISLAIPIQLNGHSITLFWTAELVILLWISQVSGIKILKTGHVLILGLVIISLLMDWNNLYKYYNKLMPVMLNQAFITGIFVIIGITVSVLLLRREKEEQFINHVIFLKTYRNLLILMLFGATFIVPFLELIYQVRVAYPVPSFQTVIYSIYVYAYLFVVLLVAQFKNQKTPFIWMFSISWVALFLYFIVFNISVLQLRDSYIFGKSITSGNFIFHYLAFPFIAGIIILLYRKHTTVLESNSFFSGLFIWFISLLSIFVLSIELDNVLVLTTGATAATYPKIIEVCHKVGYPILWGICAFILIILGMKVKIKTYRVQALCLLALIILKLFLFDVWSMSEGGRIAAFVFLGVVLLVVSFLYQKLKILLLDNKEETITQE